MSQKKNEFNTDRYFIWPVLCGALFLIADVLLFFTDVKSASILAFVIVVYYVALGYASVYSRKNLKRDIVNLALEESGAQAELMKELPIPYVLLEGDGEILWVNHAMEKVLDGKELNRLQQLFPELGRNLLPSEMNHAIAHVKTMKDKNNNEVECFYKLEIQRFHVKENNEFSTFSRNTQSMIAVYLFDQTLLRKYMIESENQRMAVGLIYIDNYDEVVASTDPVKLSMLLAVADRRISKYVQEISGIVKKTEKDRYLVIFQQKCLEKMQKDEFVILEEIKNINLGSSMHMTLSISVGINGNTYQEAYESASAGMDLALGRGGDQAVVKDGDEITYYGGNSAVVEKNTRVKARVKAQALKELLESKENVVIMGHKIPDPDSMGAAIGLYRLGLSLERKAHIVMNEATMSVRPIVEDLSESEEYDEDMFINNEQALETTDENTLLIVVDVNHSNYTECEKLLKQTNTIVILDHHRKMKDSIANPVLSYIEPYASSTCEMVAEILQYIDTKPKLKPREADAMYYGMLVDTDSFVNKTGVRTFEAAAYLKRNGANLTKVRKMSRTSMDTYKVRSKAISNSEILYGEFAITTLVGVGIDSPTVVGAQVAKELLNIDGIKASFALTAIEDRVYVSARSIDEINVQKIMEQFGGGGHLTVAGAQLVDVSLYDATLIIKETLSEMRDKGEV
ncbi:MAG: DHH family phosphoesterase [Anaerostipes sp.]|nr:DHH family phosphoesterase [Anaerostipes sp.]